MNHLGLISLVQLSIIVFYINCQDVPFDYTIEVPKFICDTRQNVKDGVTTIRLLGKDAQKLQYKFSVNFRNINNCGQAQRCTLMAWKAVRVLEHNLQMASASQRNLQEINIDNSLLMPGLEYLLIVSVMNNGTKVEDKEYVFECTNATMTVEVEGSANVSTNGSMSGFPMHSEEIAHPSLMLLGANVTYRDMMYILNAEATDCDFNCSYYFRWERIDDSDNIFLTESTKGSELQIASDLLSVPERYTVRCSLMSVQRDVVIATALQQITVLKRGIVLKLAVSTLLVGPKQPFRMSAYFRDADNEEGQTDIEWLCTSDTQRQCSGFKTINSTIFESKGFPVLGRYNITIKITKGNIIKQASCELRVVVDGFARIDVDNINEPVDSSKEIEVSVYVSMLVASCTLQWTSIEAPGRTHLIIQTIPGNLNLLTNITLKEDEFLNEIDEFSNNTKDVDYNLKILAPKGAWKGLQGNSSYLFRLNVTCPISSDDYDDDDSEPLILQNYVTLYADVPLQISKPPILNTLEVMPTQGTALKTLFKFTYEGNGSDTADYPILYKFGYFLNNETIFVANLLGVTNTKTVLPYVEKGVKTVLEGCNSRSLCSQIFGPVVKTKVPLISKEDQNNLMQQLHELMNREEYYKAFTCFLAIFQTYRSVSDGNLSVTMQNFITNLTSNEIKRLLMLSADGDKNWRIPANELMKNLELLLNNFSASEILFNNVLALRNELSRNNLKLILESANRKPASRKLLMVDEFNSRRLKREIDKVTVEEVRSYFVISELIITTSPDKRRVEQEKQNLITQVEKFLPGLCASLFDKSQTMNLELKTLILSVEKINKNSFNRYVHILYAENSWKVNGRIKLGRCFTDKLKTDQLCVGKVAFKNYLNKKGIVYMVKIYSPEETGQLDFQEDLACDSVLVLPVDEYQIQGKETACALWKKRWVQSECRTLQMTTKTIQCSCNFLGFYSRKLQYNDIQPTISTSTAVVTDQKISTTDLTTELATISNTIPTDSGIILSTFDTATLNQLSPKISTSTITTGIVSESTITTVSVLEAEIEELEGTAEFVAQADAYSTVAESSGNVSLAGVYAPEDPDATVFYFLIGFSLAGIGIFAYGIKRLLSKEESAHSNNFPKYATLYHQEMLQDLPSSN